MTRQSCLYLRGMTSGYSGSASNNPGSADAGMSPDFSTLTSIAVDGHASGYICGFGSAFMNGDFVTPYSFNIVEGYGWIGNYNNSQFNQAIGALRHLRIMLDMTCNFTHGFDILLMSDGASVTETKDYNAWGQLSRYLERERYNIYSHTLAEIQAGAFGYNGDKQYFKQFALTIFCLSATSQTIPTQMCNAIANAIKEGISFVVLQKGPGEGAANFNAIFSQLGISTQKSTSIVATKAARDRQYNQYGNHIAWNQVGQLHITQGFRSAQGYRFNDTGGTRPATLSGQPGTWIPFWCGNVDINDDYQAFVLPFFSDVCCVDPGTRYEVDFDAYVLPNKPDNWAAGLANKTHSVSWYNNTDQALINRGRIFFHAVGYGVPGSGANYEPQTNPGYTIINGTRYSEGRSYSVYKIDKVSLQVVERRQFDVHGDGGEGKGSGLVNAANMAAFLNSIDGNYWVLITMFDEASYNRKASGLDAAMYRIGASRRIFDGPKFYYRAAYCCFGSPGLGEGNAIVEMLKGEKDNDPNATFDVGFDFDGNGWPYVTGTNAITPQTQVNQAVLENGRGMRIRYGKTLDVPDLNNFFGAKYTSTFRDNRFKKLPMYETKTFVISVENPCAPKPLIQSHDWVHVVNRANNRYVRYPFKDLNEYLITTSDGSGQNEMCTSHLMMNWDMFAGIGSGTIYNSSGASHKIYCGTSNGNVDDPNSLYIQTTEEGKVWHIYERKYNLITGIPARDSNDWQVVWKWSGPGSQGHNIQIEAGYEYIVFAYDRYGSLELAERHFFVPPAEYLPKWGSNYYTRDFSNSTTFTVDRSLRCNAYCETTKDNGAQNGIMMIIRRPLYLTTGSADRTGWECIFNNNGTSVPRGNNYMIPCVKDYQYMVLCTVSDGAYSSHHFNAWNGAFDMVWEGLFEADSGGRASWYQDLQTLMKSGNSGGRTYDCFIDDARAAPIGVFQVWRRPILCWEPEDVLH